MRLRLLSLAAAAATALALGGAPAIADPLPAEPTYYVSLGDSLATGYQPDTKTNENFAYTDRIFAALSASEPTLQHIRLGCPGETTETMMNGGRCSYPDATSQLDAATKFLSAHRGQVRYVSEGIGGNDVNRCLSGGSGSAGLPDLGCITDALATIGKNIAAMNKQLSGAAGEGVSFVGMTYYNPALAGWLGGGTGRLMANATAAANNVLSATIAGANASAGWKTADIAAAFSNNDFGNTVDVPGFGPLPKNVAQICLWTWMCSSYKDIHANKTGHQVMADTFVPILTGESPGLGSGSAGSGSAR
ncbi:GDSL-type esterase/lipase family protein [Rhodococcus sp. NPDC058514]|uniref:GDSL-type esterase/lipase family protein n=1 Tax=unclassified Rhodococcus (in: high G+C Gram-positive bacteria) TaxID=192944 RepID=UPI003649A515